MEETENIIEEQNTENDTSDTKKNKLLKRLCIAIGVVLAVLVCVAVLPNNRAHIATAVGNSLFEKEEWEKAGKAYSFATDSNPEEVRAWYGLLMSKENGNSDDYKDCFNRAREAFCKISSKAFDETSVKYLLEIYLSVPDVYSDIEERISTLEEGFTLLNGPADLKNPLADAYMELVRKNTGKNYAYNLELCDKALSFSDYSDEAVELTLVQATKAYDDYVYTGDFDKAYALLEKYSNIFDEVYDSFYENVSTYEEYSLITESLLSDVYEAMKGYYTNFRFACNEEVAASHATPIFGMLTNDWSNMLMLDGSERANRLGYSFTGDRYLWAPGGFFDGYTGIGCGLYTYGDVVEDENDRPIISYYFYIGDYVNGLRDGYGIVFVEMDDTSYKGFEGSWKNDAPNGFGISYDCVNYDHTSLPMSRQVVYGNFSNGLEDGSMVIKTVLNENPDTFFVGSYKAVNGEANEISTDGLDYTFEYDKSNERLITVMQASTEGYDYVLPVYQQRNRALGVIGFSK